jgi:hypothetical protein
MTIYVDAYHDFDIITRRSITGILVMVKNRPIEWMSENQKIVET